MKDNKLIDLLDQCIYEDKDFDEFVNYCDKLPASEPNKQMLISCIDVFDVEVLYQMLFERFKQYMTAEEEMYYRQRFEKLFGYSNNSLE